MYSINDKQIDFILNDIRARGVEMESLQHDLLDHVCCLVEQNLEANGDFENFYKTTIATFYKEALWEIEEETIRLLTFKHYYTMKKMMMGSGIAATALLGLGLTFKFMYWPGASILIILGIASASLLFIPLLFTLKAKEKQRTQEKIILTIASISTSLFCISILFKILHWPYANVMGLIALLTLLFVFLPVYFVNGIRNPETKVNTFTSSVLLFLGCSLVFMLMRSPRGTQNRYQALTQQFINTEELLNNEVRWLKAEQKTSDSIKYTEAQLSNSIYEKCKDLKAGLLKAETGFTEVNSDFKTKAITIEEHDVNAMIDFGTTGGKLLAEISTLIDTYNAKVKTKPIPTQQTVFDRKLIGDTYLTTFVVFNQITHLQLFLLQHQKQSLACR